MEGLRAEDEEDLETVILQTTTDPNGFGARRFLYYLDYTGSELLQAALINLGLEFDKPYKLFIREDTGYRRWIGSFEKLRDQNLADDYYAVVTSASEVCPKPFVSSVVEEDSNLSWPKKSLERFYVDLSNYTKVRRLGTGAYGIVFLAIENATQAQVAIKELNIDPDDETQRISYEREVEILSSVEHPALLSLCGCTPFTDDLDEKTCIITPFMAGGSVDQMIHLEQKGTAPSSWNPTRKLIVLLGIASGMMSLHENRVIHRDLKPGNVLLDENLEPRICDFGISKFVPAGQSMYQTMRGGTAQFMAPELYSDQETGLEYDFKIDVYAFGIMMYMIVTGLEPFHDVHNQLALARKVTLGYRPKIPDWLPQCYQELIEQCWSTSPEQRPDFKEIVFRLGGREFQNDTIIVSEFQDYQSRVVPIDLRPVISHDAVKVQVVQSTPPQPLNTLEQLQQMADLGDAFACVQLGRKLQSSPEVPNYLSLAFDYFQRAADQGNVDGIVCLGKCYIEGNGVGEDHIKAMNLLKVAIDKGDLEAMFLFGSMLHYGTGIPRDDVQAASLWKRAADSGHVLAQCSYGKLLEKGQGVPMNVPEAVRYYKMSAEQACSKGMFSLALMYHQGKNVPKNIKEAVRLYTLVAQDGMPEACYALSEIYRFGEEEIRPNLKKAVEFAQQSAERGKFLGMVQYADLLENGIGVPKDVEKAHELYAQAHAPKWSIAQNNFALALTQGKGCRRNIPLAIKYYTIAADNGNMTSLNNLARLYRVGNGVPKNVAEAARLYKRSADAGIDSACCEYGKCLRNGFGVEQNLSEAMRYLKMAANKGCSDAMVTIGRMYQLGEGTEINMRQAFLWYQRSADRKHKIGMTYLGMMYEHGCGVKRDPQKAIKLLQEAINLKCGFAAYHLGVMYREGSHVPRDASEAKRLFQLAQSLGYDHASDDLKGTFSETNQ